MKRIKVETLSSMAAQIAQEIKDSTDVLQEYDHIIDEGSTTISIDFFANAEERTFITDCFVQRAQAIIGYYSEVYGNSVFSGIDYNESLKKPVLRVNLIASK